MIENLWKPGLGLLLGLLLLLAAPVCGVRAETINTALVAAYNNSPSLNAQRAGVRAFDENVAIAKSGLRPSLTGNANITGSWTNSNASNPVSRNTDLTTGGFGIVLSQTLWDSGLTLNNISAARSVVMAQQENLRNFEQNTLFNAASAYLDVLRDRSILAFRKRSLAFLDEQVRFENIRFDLGEANRTNVAQARASRAAAQAQVSLAAAKVKSNEAVYRQVIGNEPGKLHPVKGVASLLPGNETRSLEIAVHEHPAIKSTEYLVDQAIFNVQSAESGLLPRINLEGKVGRSYRSQNPSVINDFSISAKLSVPIYQGGRQSAIVRKNKETLGQRRIEVDRIIDNVRTAVISAYAQYKGARASLAANQEQVRAARLALEGVLEERKVGQRTTLDVLNTQTRMINAQIDLASARRELKVAGYAVLSSIGRLNVGYLGLKTTQYDPQQHLRKVENMWFELDVPGVD